MYGPPLPLLPLADNSIVGLGWISPSRGLNRSRRVFGRLTAGQSFAQLFVWRNVVPLSGRTSDGCLYTLPPWTPSKILLPSFPREVGVKHPAKTFFLLAFILAFLAWILNMIAVFVLYWNTLLDGSRDYCL